MLSQGIKRDLQRLRKRYESEKVYDAINLRDDLFNLIDLIPDQPEPVTLESIPANPTRLHLAGMAMQGMLANSNFAKSITDNPIEKVTEDFFMYADALIEYNNNNPK